jgi:DNA-binding CsgD family transcriptional regulator
MNIPLPELWRRLLRLLGYRRAPRLTFEVDQRLIRSLQELAEREQRPRDQVAADLLGYAMAQRRQAEKKLERWQGLSPREQEIAALTCLGYTNRQIAARLRISPETVKTHNRNVLRKLGVGSKIELRRLLADWDFSAWETPPA